MGSTKKVLVVEDDEDIVQLVSFLLESAGYEVATAANGREALDRVAGARPDLILLDMKMPVMGGADFAREYRATHRDLAPIVVVTAADDAQRRAADIHADGWIAKPFDPGHLLDTVRKYAGGGAGAAPPPLP